MSSFSHICNVLFITTVPAVQAARDVWRNRPKLKSPANKHRYFASVLTRVYHSAWITLNWRAARRLGEFHSHKKTNISGSAFRLFWTYVLCNTIFRKRLRYSFLEPDIKFYKRFRGTGSFVRRSLVNNAGGCGSVVLICGFCSGRSY